MRYIESWSCHNCHKRIHAWPCQYCGIGEDEHPDELALRNLVEEIAAKDAEIRQQAEDLERLRETIDRLTKSRREVATRAESLKSKCAKMREILEEAQEFIRDHDTPEAVPLVHYNRTSQLRRAAAKMERESELRRKIDAILESEEA